MPIEVDRLTERTDVVRVHTYDTTGDHHFYLFEGADDDADDHLVLAGYADSADTHSQAPEEELTSTVRDALAGAGFTLDH